MSYAVTAPVSRALRHANARPAAPPAREPTILPPTATIVANILEAGIGLVTLSGISLVLCTIVAAAL
jgi:hypothetical protein